MSKHSHYLTLNKVTAGMILADDLLDKVGHILLPAGTALSENMLRSLTAHGVSQLCIEADATPTPEELKERQMKIERIPLLFRKYPAEQPVSLLQQYIQHYREGGAS
ncbi:hypothetical protein [Undibacterium sp. WLX3042]|uniref:hypothetical protein n=1 Tax=Undibacterium sp. WLX3042 TaxID=3412686 RepID=UPI003C2FC4FA